MCGCTGPICLGLPVGCAGLSDFLDHEPQSDWPEERPDPTHQPIEGAEMPTNRERAESLLTEAQTAFRGNGALVAAATAFALLDVADAIRQGLPRPVITMIPPGPVDAEEIVRRIEAQARIDGGSTR